MARQTNRVVWSLACALAAVVLGGAGRLCFRLRPYWVARYHGRGAWLAHAPLAGAPLCGADLRGGH